MKEMTHFSTNQNRMFSTCPRPSSIYSNASCKGNIKMAEQEYTQFEQQSNGAEFEQGNYEGFEQQTEQAEGQEVAELQGGGGDVQDADDEDDRKLFVGNLSWETTQKDLKDYFTEFGEVTSCTLKTDLETRRSRGFGFVVFKEASVVDKVLEEKAHSLGGRNIDPKRANPRKEVIKKIFCGKVDPGVSETEIRKYFGTFGEIKKLELPFDKIKDQRRAFIFVEFETEDAVKKVIDKTDHMLGNQEVDVKKATPNAQTKRGRGGFGPWYGGRGGRGGNWNQGYGGYGGYGSYGNNQYGNYNYNYGYDANNYYNQGGYGGGWGYGGYDGYGGFDYGGWGYDQGQQQSSYGKTQKPGRGGGSYHPYNR